MVRCLAFVGVVTTANPGHIFSTALCVFFPVVLLIKAYLAISTGRVKFMEASPALDRMSLQEYLATTGDSMLKVLELMKEFGVRLCFL
jgi:hypothetical protein